MFHCCRRPANNDNSGKLKPTIRQCLHLRRQGIAKDMERAPGAPSFQSQLAAYHMSDGAVHVRHRSMQPRSPFNMDSPTCCGQEHRTQNHVQRMSVMIYANRTRRDTIIYHEATHPAHDSTQDANIRRPTASNTCQPGIDPGNEL